MRFRSLSAIPLLTSIVFAREKKNPNRHIKSHLRAVPRPRIIGGDEAKSTRYPFVVSLQNVQHFCGGTLIAPDVVLTAAHCTIIDFSKVVVVIGSHTVDGTVSSGGDVEECSIVRTYTHPEYNVITNEHDFALVFLKEPSKSKDFARINSDMQYPSTGNTLTALGWGDTTAEDGYDFSNELLEVDVDYIENDVCDASKDSSSSYNGMIFDAMLCASSPGKDGCQGDSGGPLIMKGSDATKDVQVGVSSWGYGCASPDFPGVYARVSSAYKWIRNRVCRRSIEPPEWFNCWEKKSMSTRFAFNKYGKRIKGKIEARNLFDRA